MATESGQLGDRALRDARGYDEDAVHDNCNAWVNRVIHVLSGPNTQNAERIFDDIARQAAAGGRALDVGCGHGDFTRRLVEDLGASYALGVDVSETQLDAARAVEVPGRIEFARVDVTQGIPGRFDLIVGRAVLHHIDFREFLTKAYAEDLAPGGRLLFTEPCAHPMTVAFHKLVKSAHTEDEFPIMPSDIRWMHDQFHDVRVIPVNLLSFPAGVISSYLCSTPDNPLMRLADRVDRSLALRPRLEAYGRQGIIVITKGGGAPGT